ncbi:putative membrane protein [Pseudocercospora fuligena]|uniref:Putative membrane protein n=1 Tax=Pseudocercospora fuligena TaxID=685502 RepID=A0A8H6VQJ0_9PEZI|nr:putative membrane protein [Pseudocercospora fuligena]
MAAGLGDQQHRDTVQQSKRSDFETNSSAPILETMGGGGALKGKEQWNTKNLSQRLVVDAGCAIAAGAAVAPIVSMIDRAIMENASGKQQLMTSIKNSMSKLFLRPHLYLTSKPFALIVMVYGGTYLSANFLDTFKSTTRSRSASHVTHGPAKFAATSAANLSLTMIKDSQFTKMFGTVSNRPVPPVTYALFALRDAMTIFASFNLPPMIAPRLPMTEAAEKVMSRTSAAQFLAPAAIQLVSTPFHLYGLDLYNRNGGTPFSDRLNKVRIDWLKSSLARMCRIVPAFGFGGVLNNSLRLRFQKQLE